MPRSVRKSHTSCHQEQQPAAWAEPFADTSEPPGHLQRCLSCAQGQDGHAGEALQHGPAVPEVGNSIPCTLCCPLGSHPLPHCCLTEMSPAASSKKNTHSLSPDLAKFYCPRDSRRSCSQRPHCGATPRAEHRPEATAAAPKRPGLGAGVPFQRARECSGTDSAAAP